MSFALEQTISDVETRVKAKKYFWLINLWVLVLIPLLICFNMLDGFFGGYVGSIAPYPLVGNSLMQLLKMGLFLIDLMNIHLGQMKIYQESLLL